jgi:hypothetical protein
MPPCCLFAPVHSGKFVVFAIPWSHRMSTPDKIDAHQKALSLNLDASAFGTFAEIGAGQEVARWFLRVGGASGTVAKTISAYDKEVSDDLYGMGTRYVSQPRLRAMLDKEWAQLLSQLDASRGAATRFFSFVDTVSARNFAGTNECHGWLGVRFQLQPRREPSDVVLHVNLQDQSNLQQQQAVGVLGVNLVYAVFHHLGTSEEFLKSVAEDLPLSRIEIDCVELSGPAFQSWDRAILHASLITLGLAEAIVFPAEGNILPPDEVLYKKAVVLAPGAFDIVERFHAELIQTTMAQISQKEIEQSKGALGLFCLSPEGDPMSPSTLSASEIIEHVLKLQKLGSGVMVFRERELYKMCAFVNRFTSARIHFALGLSVVVWALQDRYKDLSGSLLEGLARLFRENVRLSVFPVPQENLLQWEASGKMTGWNWTVIDGLVHADQLHPAKPLDHLYQYLLGCQFIVAMRPLTK